MFHVMSYNSFVISFDLYYFSIYAGMSYKQKTKRKKTTKMG